MRELKKYFVVSDIHSYYTSLKNALDEKGFDMDNANHHLIVCGDIFDRGDETLKVYEFLKSIPEDRFHFVLGNHELCYDELLAKPYPASYDYSNGTVKTFLHISGFDPKEHISGDCTMLTSRGEREIISDNWESIKENVRKSEITKWLQSSEWKNYFELGKFIFVHCFIPKKVRERYKFLEFYDLPSSAYDPDDNWRDASDSDWYIAKWGCPWSDFREGLFEHEANKGKTLVCGHWHTSDFHTRLQALSSKPITDIEEVRTCPIFYSEHLIAIDACTAATKRCNVLVINENEDGSYEEEVA